MNDYIAKLSFNFIGKILGSDTIVVQGDNLVTSKKDTILENDSAPDFRSFATFERKFLGGILTYKIGCKTKKQKFIRVDKVSEYLSANYRDLKTYSVY